jgi:AmmeMemoRadiSam system protein B
VTAPRHVRPAAVAGRFYPDDPAVLAWTVDDALDRAPAWAGPTPKALVAPHAGYPFSGPIAATAFRTLAGARGTVRRVVLVGPAHYVAVAGMATSSADAFLTPLGPVPVDVELRARVCALPGVVVDNRAHAPEHSLEVHLPFLQRVLGDFTVLPLVVGLVDARTVADVLDAVWGGPETLLVVSSDLSHYLDHDRAEARDRATADAIVAGRVDDLASEDACGARAVRGLVVAAARHGLHAELLDLRTSADTAGDPTRVVGYGAFVFGRSGSSGRR